MGSFEDIFDTLKGDWEFESDQLACKSKELLFTEESFEDFEKLKSSANSKPALTGQNSPWWQDIGLKCPLSFSRHEDGLESFDKSSCITQSCSDNSPMDPMEDNVDWNNNYEKVVENCLMQDGTTWDGLWDDDSYYSIVSFTEDASSEKGACEPEEQPLSSPSKRRKHVEVFSLDQLKDLKGSTSAEGRKMTAEERALMLYKRKLRNRYSAARSRRRRSIILNEINEQVFSLKSFIKTLQCRLLVCEREDFLSTLNERFEEIRTNLFAQWERLLSVEYQIAILRAKLMGTKVKGITSMENKAERSISFTSV